MKPSKKYIHGDNSSSTTSSSSHWNSINTFHKWNCECIEKSIKLINRKVLLRILAACVLIALIALIVTSSQSRINQKIVKGENENAAKRQRLLIDDINKAIIRNKSNDSIQYTTTASSKISITEWTIKRNISDENDVTRLSTANIIASQNEQTKKSTLAKNYVSLKMQFMELLLLPILQMFQLILFYFIFM